MHTLFCSCFHRGRPEYEEMEVIAQLARQYQQAEEKLVKFLFINIQISYIKLYYVDL